MIKPQAGKRYSRPEIAADLGVTPGRVSQLAAKLKLKPKYNGQFPQFSADDLLRLQYRRKGFETAEQTAERKATLRKLRAALKPKKVKKPLAETADSV